MTNDQAADAEGFWAWFSKEAETLAKVASEGRQDELTERMDAALTAFRLPVRYEVTAASTGPELVFTAEGDRERAAFLDDLVAKAPDTGWVLHAHRPRRTLHEALAIVHAVYGLDLRTTRFQVRVVDGRFHLRFLDDDLYRVPEDHRHQAAALFLDYALGERLATESIAGLDFQPAGEGIAMPLMVNELIRKAEQD